MYISLTRDYLLQVILYETLQFGCIENYQYFIKNSVHV